MVVDDGLPPIFEDYDPDRLAQIVAPLERAAGRPVDRDEVERELVELIHAVGRGRDGTEEALDWHAYRARLPGHAALAAGFVGLAETDDPLAAARASGDLSAELSGQIRNRWAAKWRRAGRGEPSLWTLAWSDLAPDERDEVRTMCRRLAAHHRSFVRRGRQRLNDLDTLLLHLAERWLRWTGQDRLGTADVPYSVNSRFIAFAAEALAPVGAYFEVSPKALSRRWERLVRDARTTMPLTADEDEPETDRDL